MSRVGEWAMDSHKQLETFKGYLEAIHMMLNPTILDDELPDHFEHWLDEIGIDEVIKYAETWHKIQTAEPF